MAKLGIILIVRFILLLLSYIIPKQNKILFCSYSGSRFTCNPRSIYVYMKNWIRDNNVKVTVVGQNDLNNSHMRLVKNNSIRFIFEVLTSKVLITNNFFPAYLPKLKNQLLINTWHGGGAYKKVNAKSKVEELKYKLIYSNTDLFLSSNRIFTQVMSKDCYIPKNRFFNIGMPRNDIFFSIDLVRKANERVRLFYGLNDDVNIILFAPTWRDDGRKILSDIISKDINDTFFKKFNKKTIILVRSHYASSALDRNDLSCIDVTDYPDMQELLCASDILITDYSSCMWDFSLMFKPCFLYTPDLDLYKSERSFYTNINSWPFSYAVNKDMLKNNIQAFDLKVYKDKVLQHHKSLGSYEHGIATQKISQEIMDFLLQ